MVAIVYEPFPFETARICLKPTQAEPEGSFNSALRNARPTKSCAFGDFWMPWGSPSLITQQFTDEHRMKLATGAPRPTSRFQRRRTQSLSRR